MLLNSKQYLHNVQKVWVLKDYEIEELCTKISEIQNRIYELIHYFGLEEEDERGHMEDE
jgi:hypothetical protein